LRHITVECVMEHLCSMVQPNWDPSALPQTAYIVRY
jgi:hypothetical protein